MKEQDYLAMKNNTSIDKAKLGRVKKVIASINRYKEVMNCIRQGRLIRVNLKIKGLKDPYYDINHPKFKQIEDMFIEFCKNNLECQTKILNNLNESNLLKQKSTNTQKYINVINKKQKQIKFRNFLNKITFGLVKKYYN